jgi:hypothetical protein
VVWGVSQIRRNHFEISKYHFFLSWFILITRFET